MKAFWGLLVVWAGMATAETGLDGWLRYAPLPEGVRQQFTSFPTTIVTLTSTDTSPIHAAGKELQAGIQGLLGRNLTITDQASSWSNSSMSILVTTVAAYRALDVKVDLPALDKLTPDGFFLGANAGSVLIIGQNERGALYGAFEFLLEMTWGDRKNISDTGSYSNPDAPIRWVNQWDNLDGSIERGYAGSSIFFANNTVVKDLTRVAQYARLLASVRINAVVVNNVNTDANLLNTENIEGLGKIADAMRPYGVQLGISLNFASPEILGGLKTFDPLDPSVVKWWTDKTAVLYQRIPDLAGYLVKANSEGQPGPLAYNRTLADGANLFAKAVQPYGGIVMFRAFVYNHELDWTVWKNDRANHAVELFKDLDGKFLDNVVVQIKYGPIDFQVREPASPLFAHMPNTNMAIELQITQEYLGQQSHFVYIPPLWKTIIDFDMRVDDRFSAVRNIVSGKRFNRKLGGYAGVVNVGTNTNWLGHHLSMSNLYAYGVLAWSPGYDTQALLQDWARLTFGSNLAVLETITSIAMASWPAYENYTTGSLGLPTLTDPLSNTHYGPHPASNNNNRWGRWTCATATHIGTDRTAANGSANTAQYPREVAALYETPTTTPDNLLLWFHHVPYTHRLSSSNNSNNKTVIQHLYDAHYAGAATAHTFPTQWTALRDKVDAQRFAEVLFRLEYQAGHAIVWRDAVVTYFYNMSRIPDEMNRVGLPAYHPYRIEAESMAMQGGYGMVRAEVEVGASNTWAVAVGNSSGSVVGGRAQVVGSLRGFESGRYDVAVAYFDVGGGGRASYQFFLGERLVVEWRGDLEDRLGHAFSDKVDGGSAARVTVRAVEVKRGDTLRIVGVVDGADRAALDYVALLPEGVVD